MEFRVIFQCAILCYAIQCFAIMIRFGGFKIVMELISAVFFEEEKKCKGQGVGVVFFLTVHIAFSLMKKKKTSCLER